jgi:hypothetical protein
MSPLRGETPREGMRFPVVCSQYSSAPSDTLADAEKRSDQAASRQQ